MKNDILRYGLMLTIFLTHYFPLLAGPEDPPLDDDPLPAPLDDGFLILLFLGIMIGVYMIIYKKRQFIKLK